MTTMHSELQLASFIASIVILVISLAFVLIRSSRREKRSSDLQWKEIVAKVDTVNRGAVHAIATDLLEGRDSIAPEQLYGMLGGLQGMERLDNNCEVLVELATFVQRWHPEALLVAEELRLGAREIKWHVERLRGAAAAGHLKTTFPDNAQQAVRVYFKMTRRVLALYEDTALGSVATLQHAL